MNIIYLLFIIYNILCGILCATENYIPSNTDNNNNNNNNQENANNIVVEYNSDNDPILNNIVIYEAEDLDNTPLSCGSVVYYWSKSCGAILSSASRHCSGGGTKVYASSCNTHFARGSRGCGFALLGCQSLCRKQALPCSSGSISFVSSHHHVASSTPKIDILLMRSHGYDYDVGVDVLPCDTHYQTYVNQSNKYCDITKDKVLGHVVFKHNDKSPKIISLNLNNCLFQELDNPMYGRHAIVSLCMKIRDDDNDNNNDINKIRLEPYATTLIDVNTPPDIVKFAKSTYNVTEGSYLDVEIQRVGTGIGAASVQLVHIGGTATYVEDFITELDLPHTLYWSELTPETNTPCNYPCIRKKSLRIYFRTSDIPEEDETIILALRNHRNVWMAASDIAPQYTTINIRNVHNITVTSDNINDNAIFNKTSKLQRLTRIKTISDLLVGSPLDSYAFADRTSALKFSEGDIIVDERSKTYELYVIESGSVISCTEHDHTREVLTEGSLFSLMRCLYDVPRIHKFVAKTNSIVWMIKCEAVQMLMEHNILIRENLERIALKRMMSSMPSRPPLILFPGLMSTRLVSWKRKACRGLDIDIMDTIWLSTEKVLQTLFSDANCWLDCLSLGMNQTDPTDCIARPMDGIEAISELERGLLTTGPTTIFRRLITYFANEYSYSRNDLIPIPYDWRLSPDLLERRDGLFSQIKLTIERSIIKGGVPGIAIGHSQGNLVFLQFVEWLKCQTPHYEEWLNKHIRSFIGLGAPLLGSMDSITGILEGLTLGLPISNQQAKKMASSFGSMAWFHPSEPNDISDSDEKQSLWSDLPMVTVDTTNNTFEYLVKDLYIGEWLKQIYTLTNDSMMLNQYNILRNNYKDKDNCLAVPKNGYKRPPIRYVHMIYGVNIETPIAANYSINKKNYLQRDILYDEISGGSIVEHGKKDITATNKFNRSGDGTVPYASLSWSSTWHYKDNINHTHFPATIVEYYENPVGKWGERSVLNLMNSHEPAFDMYCSYYKSENVSSNDRVKSFMKSSPERRTCILEVDRAGHRDLVKDPFIEKLIDRIFLQMFAPR